MRITFAQIATATPMGQQAYETAIQAAVARAVGPEVQLRQLRISSLRNGVVADRRVPWGAVERAPGPVARLVGAWTYRGGGLVHRLDLRLPPSAWAEVVTVHDLPGLRFSDEGSVPRSLAAGARRARAVIVPSTFAGQEVIELLGVDAQRLHVIPYGLSSAYSAPPARPTTIDLEAVTGRFVVHAAGATRRKNLAALAAAWEVVAVRAPDVQLLLCGPEDVRRTRAFAGLAGVRLLGRLPPGDVAWLMHRAAAVVVPSTYEGFGLPALEGMAAGTPVVAARAGALPEVCADAALLVEPDGAGLAAGLLDVLDDDGLRDQLCRRGPLRAAEFDWGRAADDHLAVYRSVG